MRRVCTQCSTVLTQYNPGKLCFPCQEKQLEQRITYNEEIVNAMDFAFMLGLKNAESVKRLGRKGKLPPRIPGVYQWLWLRSIVEDWRMQEGIGNKELRMAARGITNNLRRCRFDSVICLGPSYKIGSKVYGQEHVFGTTDTGRVESITLVKVDRPVALNALKQLPKKDFPKLSDITDWADLTYDSISEDLIVRLEAYF